jgi:predicted dehydrogenase
MNRRTFLYRTLAGSAGAAFTARSWSQVKGANSNIRHAVIGFNSRGKSHIQGFRKLPGVKVVALCDVDAEVLNRETQALERYGNAIDPYTDIRRLLERKDIDTISIATPNHWHSLAAIWGIQAGKDVYVEKPVSHEVWEGRQLVEAARKHNKIVQTGTQIRSNPGVREAIQYIHDGKLGKVLVARGLCYKRRASIGKVTQPQTPPATVDYDLWCGPAPMGPLMRKNLHYDWHWVWPTGNGDLGNQGIHQMDVARWALKQDALSPAVFSVGGRVGYDDDGETPNTMFIIHDYAEAPLIFEVRGLPEKSGSNKMDQFHGSSIGNIIHCENGNVVFPNYDSAIVYDKDWAQVKKFSGGADHFANFIKAVRSRKREDLNADIIEGHLSSALCHTGNISYLVGSQQDPNEIREKIESNKEALETFGRMQEHLAANQVDLTKYKLTMGEHLKMDPASERFKGNFEANRLLKRNYRKPFVVPDRV